MLNSKKLLYVMPDVAYVVELLPTKKANQFSLHSLKQINGEFLDDRAIHTEAVSKLLDKLDVEPYTLVLPDSWFTLTITGIKEDSLQQAESLLTTEWLPKYELQAETHQILTSHLTEFKGTHKFQVSAIEKSVLEPWIELISQKGLPITEIVSVSWSIKSVISLEPSISVIQLGEQLYLAQHYIGVEQTNSVTVADYPQLVETIKTLKGVESSIQTVYVLTNELVENNLREALAKIVPVQQLAASTAGDAKVPPYLVSLFEAGIKTLQHAEYQAPIFMLKLRKGAQPVQSEAAQVESDKKSPNSPKSTDQENIDK